MVSTQVSEPGSAAGSAAGSGAGSAADSAAGCGGSCAPKKDLFVGSCVSCFLADIGEERKEASMERNCAISLFTLKLQIVRGATALFVFEKMAGEDKRKQMSGADTPHRCTRPRPFPCSDRGGRTGAWCPQAPGTSRQNWVLKKDPGQSESIKYFH